MEGSPVYSRLCRRLRGASTSSEVQPNCGEGSIRAGSVPSPGPVPEAPLSDRETAGWDHQADREINWHIVVSITYKLYPTNRPGTAHAAAGGVRTGFVFSLFVD